MQSILLLNQGYQPLSVISLRDAVGLLLRGAVERVGHDIAHVLKTPSGRFRVPSVLRLKIYHNVPDRRATWSRKAVLQRDHYTCGYCGRRGYTIDHIVPVSEGGRNTWANTICACDACNQRKANRTPRNAGMRLRWEPKTPRVNYVV
ncbi:HNH endonuclease, partial [Candidatus Uhrbacteria bacterium]|nr:HNH endonuclease [Candidatus Uhrbacteria bacterium]